jgi:hypothetical protein
MMLHPSSLIFPSRAGRAALGLGLVALLAAGCSSGQLETLETAEGPLLSATPAEVKARAGAEELRILAIKADLELGFQAGPGEKVERCRAKLLAERREVGAGIYLKGYRRLVPTFFTLVSDGREFWLHLPRDDKVITGPVDLPRDEAGTGGLSLSPLDLTRALFYDALDSPGDAEIVAEDEHYVLTQLEGWRPRRQLRIERRQLTVSVETYYDEEGRAELEIRRGGFARVATKLFPTQITILDPLSGAAIFLNFTKLDLDPASIPTAAFRFEPPEGVAVERRGGGEADS